MGPCQRRVDSKKWSLAPADEHSVVRLAADTGLSHVVARILVSRGIESAEQAKRFIEPSLGRDWLDPSLIPGMDAAAERVARAVQNEERILVFGDFDLDGISAAAVARRRDWRRWGRRSTPMVPHRFRRRGYGLTPASIDRVLELSPDLVVTVDCGISSAEEVAQLLSYGVDVVVTDHHEPGECVPARNPGGQSRSSSKRARLATSPAPALR